MSFEAIAENLVAQEDFETLEIVGEDITMVAERVSSHNMAWFLCFLY